MGTCGVRWVVRCSRLRGRGCSRGYRDRGPGHSLCTVHSRVPPKAPTMRFSVSLRGNRLFPSTTEAANGVSGGKSRVFGIIFFDPTAFLDAASDWSEGATSAVAGGPGKVPVAEGGRVGRCARLVSRAVGASSRAGPCATVPT